MAAEIKSVSPGATVDSESLTIVLRQLTSLVNPQSAMRRFVALVCLMAAMFAIGLSLGFEPSIPFFGVVWLATNASLWLIPKSVIPTGIFDVIGSCPLFCKFCPASPNTTLHVYCTHTRNTHLNSAVDGKVIYSKFATGRFPAPGEIAKLLTH